jgi:hypothetical protein
MIHQVPVPVPETGTGTETWLLRNGLTCLTSSIIYPDIVFVLTLFLGQGCKKEGEVSNVQLQLGQKLIKGIQPSS